jgi:hypothetical protein
VPFLLLPLALFLRSLGESPRPGRESGAWGQVLAAGVAVALVVLSMLTTSVMTLLNYISDTFTNALYQVALPLALRGFLPHTWLSLLGVPNPWAALPAMACLAAAVRHHSPPQHTVAPASSCAGGGPRHRQRHRDRARLGAAARP